MKYVRNLVAVSLVLVCVLLVISAKKKESRLPLITKIELGQKLFFEKALSLDSSISCASCHIPTYAFSDTVALSKGVNGRLGLRNAPSVMNVKFRDKFFYDGRANDIFDQIHFPVEDPNEMNLNFEEAIKRLNGSDFYVEAFKNLYGRVPDKSNVADAISEFEKSLESSETPFDRYMNGQENALNESEKRGREIFLADESHCFDCHFGPDFTGDEFRNIGLFDGIDWKDVGRFKITGDSSDLGKFKVPGLRNVGVTGPYMHDGRFKTLKEVIEYYNDPRKVVKNPINMDTVLLKPLNLNEQQKTDLLNFLLSLTDDRFKNR
ncbi:MAG TPA: cytochrome c peroxidase [Bacteroidia bacterium]